MRKDRKVQQIIRRAGIGKQIGEMLFKVWLKDSQECWLLIHIEVQGEKEKGMPYLSSLERMGFDKGLKKGLDKGLKKGQEIGLRKGLLEGIGLVLENKFGQRGRRLLPRAKAIGDVAELRDLARVIKEAETLDDIRRHLS